MIQLLGDRSKRIVAETAALLPRLGFAETHGSSSADLIVAPLLGYKIPQAEIERTRYGALVFHPSLLPAYRGRNAIKDAFANNERESGATWFWANGGFDKGDICEQEALVIAPGESPREFYERAVIPAALRLLGYALVDIRAGYVRRRPQQLAA